MEYLLATTRIFLLVPIYLFFGLLGLGLFFIYVFSKENYYRLTIPRMLWMGFQGLGERAGMLLNIADIMHTPQEFDRKEKNEIQYNWEV